MGFLERFRPRPERQQPLGTAAEPRSAAVRKCWTYYHGADPSGGESQWTHLYRRFPSLVRREVEDVENHTRICTNRLKRLLVNSWRGFEFDDPETGRLVTDVLDHNRWPHLLNLIALSGLVTGDAFLKLIPLPEGMGGMPVRIVLLDAGSVELLVSPHDRDDIRGVTVSYEYVDRSEEGAMERHTYREVIDTVSVSAFVDDEAAPEFSSDHGLGFLPVVHVRNADTGGGIYGESLVGRLMDAQDGLNMLTADLVDIVRYDGHKTTIFQNVTIDRGASRDGQTPGEVDLSIGKGLVVRGEGRVYKLEQQHDLGAALEEYDRKVDVFYDLAGVPRLSRDLVTHLGNLSGRAIERLYQDAIEATREAQTLYGASFVDLAGRIAAMLGRPSGGIRALWNTDVISPDIATLARELEIGARSVRSVMKKLGIVDADRMFAEIDSEAARTTTG